MASDAACHLRLVGVMGNWEYENTHLQLLDIVLFVKVGDLYRGSRVRTATCQFLFLQLHIF